MKPKTEFVTRVEGGEWIPFEEFTEIRPRRRYDNWVHSIKFEDGSIWDAVNGWRREKPRYCYNWKTAEWDLVDIERYITNLEPLQIPFMDFLKKPPV